MKKKDTPQDHSQTYSGHKKVIYATNKGGDYEKVKSSGWEVEEFVTLMAVNDLHHLSQEAYKKVKAKLTAPLEFHMYNKRLDPLGLSQATGFFQWQIKRHFKPNNFAQLSEKKLKKYSDALGLNLNELRSIPDELPEP